MPSCKRELNLHVKKNMKHKRSASNTNISCDCNKEAFFVSRSVYPSKSQSPLQLGPFISLIMVAIEQDIAAQETKS